MLAGPQASQLHETRLVEERTLTAAEAAPGSYRLHRKRVPSRSQMSGALTGTARGKRGGYAALDCSALRYDAGTRRCSTAHLRLGWPNVALGPEWQPHSSSQPAPAAPAPSSSSAATVHSASGRVSGAPVDTGQLPDQPEGDLPERPRSVPRHYLVDPAAVGRFKAGKPGRGRLRSCRRAAAARTTT
jgi:hypothetical protein